jgi:hypothetical protein
MWNRDIKSTKREGSKLQAVAVKFLRTVVGR